MSRRHSAEKRQIHPDARYGDVILSKFINCLMMDGKKSIAEKMVYGALEDLSLGADSDVVEFFHDVLNAVKPEVEVRSRRVGGATYQVPVDVRPERALALSIRWLIASAKKRSENTMRERLKNELRDAKAGRGSAVKKREDTHKMAEANKAFSHFRW